MESRRSETCLLRRRQIQKLQQVLRSLDVRFLGGERKEEAIKSLQQENVQQERTWIVEIQGEKYFIAYMESQDKNILEMNKDMPINKDHASVLKECLEWPLPVSDLYDITLDK